MKTIIIYSSFHHKNTERIAKEIGLVLAAKIVKLNQVDEKEIIDYDLIGFGSGIYFSKFEKKLLAFIKKLPEMKNKNVFIFSTAGIRKNIFLNRGHNSIKKLLKDKKFNLVGEFSCPGYDSYGLLKYFGGINKGRPNSVDIKRARTFANNLK